MASEGAELASTFPGRISVVSYHDLTQNPHDVLTATARHFGIDSSNTQIAIMGTAARVYSKDPAGMAVFDPSGAHARPSLPEADSDRVVELTSHAEARLALLADHARPTGWHRFGAPDRGQVGRIAD
jgi:hypothetical protein